jgi:hypothetical protein
MSIARTIFGVLDADLSQTVNHRSWTNEALGAGSRRRELARVPLATD